MGFDDLGLGERAEQWKSKITGGYGLVVANIGRHSIDPEPSTRGIVGTRNWEGQQSILSYRIFFLKKNYYHKIPILKNCKF